MAAFSESFFVKLEYKFDRLQVDSADQTVEPSLQTGIASPDNSDKLHGHSRWIGGPAVGGGCQQRTPRFGEESSMHLANYQSNEIIWFTKQVVR